MNILTHVANRWYKQEIAVPLGQILGDTNIHFIWLWNRITYTHTLYAAAEVSFKPFESATSDSLRFHFILDPEISKLYIFCRWLLKKRNLKVGQLRQHKTCVFESQIVDVRRHWTEWKSLLIFYRNIFQTLYLWEVILKWVYNFSLIFITFIKIGFKLATFIEFGKHLL